MWQIDSEDQLARTPTGSYGAIHGEDSLAVKRPWLPVFVESVWWNGMHLRYVELMERSGDRGVLQIILSPDHDLREGTAVSIGILSLFQPLEKENY